MKGKIKRVLAMGMVLVSTLCLTACGNKVDTGSWNGDIFTTKYAGIQMEVPLDTWTKMSSTDISTLTSVPSSDIDEMATNPDKVNDMAVAPIMAVKRTEQCYVITEYVDLKNDLFNSMHDENDYMDSLKIEMNAKGFTVGESRSDVMAGRTFISCNATLDSNGITIYGDYYITKEGSKLLVIIAAYTPSFKSGVDDIIESIQPCQ